VALPQPKPSEQVPNDGATPTLSLAGSHLGRTWPDAVWFTVCAWCERMDTGGRWIEIERALELIDDRPGHELRLTHGICPSCFAAEMYRTLREH
jgi:hypothetical protein